MAAELQFYFEQRPASAAFRVAQTPECTAYRDWQRHACSCDAACTLCTLSRRECWGVPSQRVDSMAVVDAVSAACQLQMYSMIVVHCLHNQRRCLVSCSTVGLSRNLQSRMAQVMLLMRCWQPAVPCMVQG
jgi:hypothetical protein